MVDGLLGGRPSVGETCDVCGVGIAVSVWRAPTEREWQVRTAHFKASGRWELDHLHRLEMIGDCVVSLPDMATFESGELQASAFVTIRERVTDFLLAWQDLHGTCQGDTRDVDET